MFCIAILLTKVIKKVIILVYDSMLIALLEFQCEYRLRSVNFLGEGHALQNGESESEIYYKFYVNRQICSVLILCYDYSTILSQPLVTVTIVPPLIVYIVPTKKCRWQLFI